MSIVLTFLHTHSVPVKRKPEQLILQPDVVAHEVAATFLEVVEHEICLASLQHGADETSLPVAEEFRAVDYGYLRLEASLLVNVGMYFF